MTVVGIGDDFIHVAVDPFADFIKGVSPSSLTVYCQQTFPVTILIGLSPFGIGIAIARLKFIWINGVACYSMHEGEYNLNLLSERAKSDILS